MSSPRDLATLARKSLRYFRYWPPAGGFGGDWDVLAATAVFADDADLNRMLTAFGYAGTPPLGPHTTDLGMFDVEGVSVSLEVTRVVSPGRPGEARTLRLTAGVYVTAEVIAQAARLEAWLDAHHVAMRRAADSR